VTYAEDDGDLRRQYGVSPAVAATVVVGPRGDLLWKSEGTIDPAELAAVLGKVLVKAAPPKATLLSTSARIDQRAPNFLFEGAPGQPVTLRKISGRKVVLVFFNRSSQPSMDAIRDAIAARGSKTVVIAISDGEGSPSGDLSPAIVVPDRKREIANAYGVTMWPTIISIDESGIVRSIAYGRLTTGEKSRA
jgi:peroxiredoxin